MLHVVGRPYQFLIMKCMDLYMTIRFAFYKRHISRLTYQYIFNYEIHGLAGPELGLACYLPNS